jgi:tRNA(fMet)-specific endonuclease VapC
MGAIASINQNPCQQSPDGASLFFRGNANVVARFQTYSTECRQISLSIVSYYEILSGLMHRDAQRQISVFLEFAAQNSVGSSGSGMLM